MGSVCAKGREPKPQEDGGPNLERKAEGGGKPAESERVPKGGSFFRQASLHTVKRLAKVRSKVSERTLDALESFGSFNHSGSFSKAADKRVGILSFEATNVIMKALNLRVSLLSEEMQRFRSEVLLSEGVKTLVSKDLNELWRVAALDRRVDLQNLANEVVRLAKQTGNPDLLTLEARFARMGQPGEPPGGKLSSSEINQNIEWLQDLIASTADLYHELHALDSSRAALKRREAEEALFPGTLREVLVSLRQEVKDQERLVRNLKRRSIWGKRLGHIVDLLAELVFSSHKQLVDAFSVYGVPKDVFSSSSSPPVKDPNRLGTSGLALHFANIITEIDNMAARPNLLSLAARDKLYQMLPFSVRKRVRQQVRSAGPIKEEALADTKVQMDKVLGWLSAVATNTIRWATDRRLQGHSDLYLLQTLHHADQAKTEAVIVDLVVGLHQLVVNSKSPFVLTRERAAYLHFEAALSTKKIMLPPLASYIPPDVPPAITTPVKLPPQVHPIEGGAGASSRGAHKSSSERKSRKGKSKKRSSSSKHDSSKPVLLPPPVNNLSPPPLDPTFIPPPDAAPTLEAPPEILQARLEEIARGRAAVGDAAPEGPEVPKPDEDGGGARSSEGAAAGAAEASDRGGGGLTDAGGAESSRPSDKEGVLREFGRSGDLPLQDTSPRKSTRGGGVPSSRGSQELRMELSRPKRGGPGSSNGQLARTLSPGNGGEVDIDRIEIRTAEI